MAILGEDMVEDDVKGGSVGKEERAQTRLYMAANGDFFPYWATLKSGTCSRFRSHPLPNAAC
jgi:hypothetical protein